MKRRGKMEIFFAFMKSKYPVRFVYGERLVPDVFFCKV